MNEIALRILLARAHGRWWDRMHGRPTERIMVEWTCRCYRLRPEGD